MNLNLLDFTLKTELGSFRRDAPLVFTTGKTLHERFTPPDARCVFIVKCGYIPPSEFSGTKERLVFSNRRCVEVNERFTAYQNCEFKKMENKRLENRKRLEQELRLMAKKRRTVITSATTKEKDSGKLSSSSKKSQKSVSRLDKKSPPPENSCYNISVSSSSRHVDKFKNFSKHRDIASSSESAFFNTPVTSNKFYDKFRSFTRPTFNRTAERYSTPMSSKKYGPDTFRCYAKNDDDFGAGNGTYDANGYYNVIGTPALFKHPDRNRRFVCTPNYSGSLKFPEKYEYFKNRRLQRAASPYHFYAQRESMYRWKRQPVTKEQLDDELDRYMSEVKFKPAVMERDDVDSFVEEYLLETEKYLNNLDSFGTFD